MSSVTVLLLIAIPTIIQLVGFGIQLPIISIIIGRCLYLSRLLGINISINVSLIIEGLTFFWMIVRPILFQEKFNKIEFIVFLLIFIFVVIIEFINESLYVYEDISISEYNEMMLRQRVFDETLTDKKKHKSKNKAKKKRGR